MAPDTAADQPTPAAAIPYEGTDRAAGITGDTLERILHAALRDGDVIGVHAALSIMAITDPRRAEQLLSALRDASAVARLAAKSPTPPPDPHPAN